MPACSSSSPGRVLMVGVPGAQLDSRTAQRLRELGPGGVILFGRNLESPSQAIALLARLRELLPRPPLFALDQEGGRVSRLEPWVGPTPTAAALARAGVDAVTRFAAATAGALRSLGFNLDFAPVVDLSTVDATNGIGDRSFGTDPRRVAELAGAFVDGLQQNRVAACLKHFPGLGPTSVDSHVELPTADRTRDDLERLDLDPYRRLGERAASVMVGHAHYPELDPQSGRPATLSRIIVETWLRGRAGYGGLVATDDLEMGAVAHLDEDGAAAVESLRAGCDLLLYCADLDRAERARAAIARAAASDPVLDGRLQRAAQAVDALARRWPAPAGDAATWQSARDELARSAASAAGSP